MIHETTARGTLFPAAITRTRRRKLTAATLAFAVLGTPALVTSASAVIQDPAPAPFEVVVFPERDFVMVGGFAPNTALDFSIIRNGVTIGTASSGQVTPALLTDADGILEVNHPGGLCWSGVTPNILPQDRLVVVESGTTNGVATNTQNVTAGPAEVTAGGDVVVRGIARNADGTPMALGRVEQRIVNPAFREAPDALVRRDIRAVAGAGLVRDPAVSGGFIATHSGLTAAQQQKAVGGNIRTLGWQATDGAGNRLGITIFEVGEVGGPGFGGCPLGANYAVTSASPAAVKVGQTGLSLAGTSNDATRVTVTLRDRNPVTADQVASAVPRPATGAQTFRVAFTKAQVARLSDGSLTAVGRYATGGGEIGGVTKTIVKDLTVPNAPRSDTRSGSYSGAQSVTLSLPRGDARSRIFYTTDGRNPSLVSTQATRPIRVTSTKTLRAIVVDAAGNKSASNCATGQGCWRIAIGASRPFITSRSPQAGATGVSRLTNVHARFNERLSGTSVNGATVMLRRNVAGASDVRAAVSYRRGSVTLNPGRRLRPGATYKVVLTARIKDLSGRTLRPASWTFRTGR